MIRRPPRSTQGVRRQRQMCIRDRWCAVVRSAAKGGTKLPEATAKRMIINLNKRFRATHATHQRARQLVKNGALTVMLPYGHRRAFLPGQATHTKWLNTTIQGTAAVGFKQSLLEMDRRGLIYHIGGLVHDEFVATGIPEAAGQEFAAEMEDSMKLGMQMVMDDIAQRNPKTTFIPVPIAVSYTHLTLPTYSLCRSRWSPCH